MQIVQKVSSVKSIDFDNGVMGLSLGLSFLMKNNYVEDTSISWLSRMDNYVYKVAVKTLDMDIKIMISYTKLTYWYMKLLDITN